MRRLLLALVLALLPAASWAQESAALVADTLLVTADERLIAEGNVQAFYEGTTLSARRVTYDRRADRLLIEGPILVREADGTILTAERADLDPRLEQGLLRGARLVLDRQLQLAANRVDRLEGLTALTGAAVTSCQVCPGQAPLYEIRAAQVIYDEVGRQLYFEDASFLIRGVPILWIPRLRLPAPDNERATGLLLPRLRSSSRLGLGVELPYFIELGPSRDLTLTPLIATGALSIEALYRQAFLNGELEVSGALSRDELRPGETRGYLAAEGEFLLAEGTVLAFGGAWASDRDYLEDYGLHDGEVLESGLRLARADATTLVEGGLSFFQDLGEEEDDTVPTALGDLSWERRRDLAGGILTLGADLDVVLRTQDGTAGAARDAVRAGAFADWRREAVLAYGVLLEGQARGRLDAYRITDDPDFERSLLRAAPAAALTLRWPLVRRGAGGTSDLLEPVASLGWSSAFGDEPPADDSRLPELDEANLFALTRLPGEDDVEEGGRLSLGLGWTRQGPGFASRLAFGRVLRTEPQDLSEASGLAGTASDWLLAGDVTTEDGLSLGARALLGGDLGADKAEAFLGWDSEALSLEAGYVRLPADAAGGRPERAEELSFEAEVQASERWTIRTEARYDLVDSRAERLGLGLEWRNECVEVDLSVARRYTSPGEEPSTDFGLSVDLLGFSTGDRPRVAPGACRG